MREITEKVYFFEELDKEIQKKVLNESRDINVNYDWYQDVFDYWTEKLEDLGFQKIRIGFSGFWSQGDGASFTAESVDIGKNLNELFKYKEISTYTLNKRQYEQYLKAYHLYHSKKEKFKKVIDSLYLKSSIKRTSYRYSHHNTAQADLGLYLEKDYPKLEYVLQGVEVAFENYKNRLCNAIYQDLESEYEYLTSDEAVIDTIVCNGHEFYSNGEMY